MAHQVMALTLVGAGESLLRLQKRLGCAATELGITLQLDIEKNPDVWHLSYAQTPAVLSQGTLLLTGLMRTEDIVPILRAILAESAMDKAGDAK